MSAAAVEVTAVPLPCPRCGKAPTLENQVFALAMYCGNCSDGESSDPIGVALSRVHTIGAWNESVAEYLAERADEVLP